MTRYIAAILILSTHQFSAAKEFEIGQKNKAFTRESIEIKVGDVVHFSNQDPFFHNIYSISQLQPFDLGSYPKGQQRSVTFNKAGVISVECAIHPTMKIDITVKN